MASLIEPSYGIFITCWYQEIPNETQTEVYNSLKFNHIDDAIIFLFKNRERILDEYPIDSIEIKLIKNE